MKEYILNLLEKNDETCVAVALFLTDKNTSAVQRGYFHTLFMKATQGTHSLEDLRSAFTKQYGDPETYAVYSYERQYDKRCKPFTLGRNTSIGFLAYSSLTAGLCFYQNTTTLLAVSLAMAGVSAACLLWSRFRYGESVERLHSEINVYLNVLKGVK